MLSFLKKGLDIIAPKSTNPFDDFKNACSHSIRILKREETEENSSLNDCLNLIQESLKEEINEIDQKYLTYIIDTSFLENFVEAISIKKLQSVHVEPILNFFLDFLNTELNIHFAQKAVHASFGFLLTKIDVFYYKKPEETTKFLKSMWNAVIKSPLIIDMTSSQSKEGVKKSPFIDFMCDSVFSSKKCGKLAREFVLSVFIMNNQHKYPYEKQFMTYTAKKIFPELCKQICYICECAETVQFSGSASTILSWSDQFLINAGDFDMSEVVDTINAMKMNKKVSAILLILSYFIYKPFVEKVEEIARSEEVLKYVLEVINSDDKSMMHIAISFIKSMLLNKNNIAYVLPKTYGVKADVITIMPTSWLSNIEGEFSIDSYKQDAAAKLLMMQNSVKGTDDSFYDAVLNTFARFKSLDITTAISLTGLISAYICTNPMLINERLSQAYENAVKDYQTVENIPVIKEDDKDSNEFRAAVLAEFGKEIHATYLASEKLIIDKTMFDDEL